MDRFACRKDSNITMMTFLKIINNYLSKKRKEQGN